MYENKKFGGLPKKPKISIEREPDPETLEFMNLYNYFIEKYGKTARGIVMDYIEKYTGGTSENVVNRWLNWSTTGHIPSSGIRTGIISALEDMKENPPQSLLSDTKDTSPDIIKPETPIVTKPTEPGFENPTTNQIVEANKRELADLMKKLKREGKTGDIT